MVLVTVGSLGDLHPFIAVGLALQQRGVHVVLASAAEYRSKVEAVGLGFHAVRPSFEDLERQLGMDRAALTRALLSRGDFLFSKVVLPSLRPSYEDLSDLIGGADLVLTSSLAISARLAAEKAEVPWIAVVLQPLMFLSAFDPPVLPAMAWLTQLSRRLGPHATRPFLTVIKRLAGLLLRPVGAFRAQIGLPPARCDPLFDGQFSSDGALGLYPSLLGAVQEDYPRPTSIVGFAVFDSDEGGSVSLDSKLDAFLRQGAPPLVFTLGSLIVNSPGAFYRESVAAARLLGKRAVLLMGDSMAGAHPWHDARDVHVAGYAPHSQIFPRAEAVVHHGGIGTLAQALCSGRPQLIVPHYADQADNAARAVRLGLARTLAPTSYRAASAARELARLTTLRSFAERAVSVRDRLALEDGAAAAAAAVLDRLELGSTERRRIS